MELYEIILEDNEDQGVEAISLVDRPAIEENFIALSDDTKISLASVDDEKRIVIGAILVPDKAIYRNDGNKEYYIFFSKDTIRRTAEKYMLNKNIDKATEEHGELIKDVHLMETWLVEDEQYDKSRKYDLSLPVGTWAGTMKINNDEIWSKIKKGELRGFSIEGVFSNMLVSQSSQEIELSEQELDDLDLRVRIEDVREILAKSNKYELQSYSDYPQAARNNARRALKYKKENGSSCGTSVGWTRASQLASGAALSRSTIARMASFKRHQQHKDVPYSEGCGGIMWDAWGGSAGVNWAIRKLKQIDKDK